MKKLIACLSIVLVAGFGVVGFSACKKTSVVGTWKYDHTEYYDQNGKLLESVGDNFYNSGKTFTFNKNGTGVFVDANDTTSHDWNFEWKQKKNKVIIAGDDYYDLIQIKKGKLIARRTYTAGDYVCVVFKKVK